MRRRHPEGGEDDDDFPSDTDSEIEDGDWIPPLGDDEDEGAAVAGQAIPEPEPVRANRPARPPKARSIDIYATRVMRLSAHEGSERPFIKPSPWGHGLIRVIQEAVPRFSLAVNLAWDLGGYVLHSLGGRLPQRTNPLSPRYRWDDSILWRQLLLILTREPSGQADAISPELVRIAQRFRNLLPPWLSALPSRVGIQESLRMAGTSMAVNVSNMVVSRIPLRKVGRGDGV